MFAARSILLQLLGMDGSLILGFVLRSDWRAAAPQKTLGGVGGGRGAESSRFCRNPVKKTGTEGKVKLNKRERRLIVNFSEVFRSIGSDRMGTGTGRQAPLFKTGTPPPRG